MPRSSSISVSLTGQSSARLVWSASSRDQRSACVLLLRHFPAGSAECRHLSADGGQDDRSAPSRLSDFAATDRQPATTRTAQGFQLPPIGPSERGGSAKRSGAGRYGLPAAKAEDDDRSRLRTRRRPSRPSGTEGCVSPSSPWHRTPIGAAAPGAPSPAVPPAAPAAAVSPRAGRSPGARPRSQARRSP